MKKNFVDFDSEIIEPENKNGKKIILTSQICFNWSYSIKKAIVSTIGNSLSEYGFEIKINHLKDFDKKGMFRIYVEVNGVNLLVFSTNFRDKNKIALIGNTPKDCFDRLVKLIIMLVSEN